MICERGVLESQESKADGIIHHTKFTKQNTKTRNKKIGWVECK